MGCRRRFPCRRGWPPYAADLQRLSPPPLFIRSFSSSRPLSRNRQLKPPAFFRPTLWAILSLDGCPGKEAPIFLFSLPAPAIKGLRQLYWGTPLLPREELTWFCALCGTAGSYSATSTGLITVAFNPIHIQIMCSIIWGRCFFCPWYRMAYGFATLGFCYFSESLWLSEVPNHGTRYQISIILRKIFTFFSKWDWYSMLMYILNQWISHVVPHPSLFVNYVFGTKF
jgi:hypothetical protein